MKKFTELYDFIDRAIKSRNYPENTGISLKTALKLFEKELNEEERNSISEFSKNIEQIYSSVCSKAKNFSAGSLATYKSRVIKVLTDYEKYGIDPTKMSGWPKKTISTRTKRNQDTSNYFKGNDFIGLGKQTDHPFMFNDSGTGWNVSIKSTQPISSEIKKSLIDISDSLKEINDKE